MGVFSQITTPDESAIRWLADAALWLLYVTAAAVLLFHILRRRDLPLPRAFWLVVTYVLAFGAVELLEAAFYWRNAEPLSLYFKALIALIAWGAAVLWVAVVPRLLGRRDADHLQQAEKKRKQAEKALKESESFYQTMIDSLPINVFHKDLDGHIVYASLPYCETLGHKLEDLLGKTDHDLFPNELADKYVRDDAHVVSSGETLEVIERHQRPDGTEILVQVLKAPVRDNKGAIIGVQGMFWDVTSREQAEEAHRESEARLKSIMDNTAAVIYLKDQDYRYVMINRRYEQLFNVTNEEVHGKTDFDIWPAELAEAFQANDRIVLETGEIVECEEAAAQEDGLHTYLSVKFPLRNAQGEIYAVAGISTDITERKQTELALRESENRRDLALEAAGIGTWTWTISDNSLQCDDRLHHVFGVARQDVPHTIEAFISRVHSEDRERVRQALDDAIKNNADYDIDFRIERGDGTVRNVVSRAAVIHDQDETPLRMTGVCLDVTERERAEQALREVEERMRRVVESAHDAFIAINDKGYVIEWNHEAERTFGWQTEEAVGTLLCDLIVPEPDRARAAAAIGAYMEGHQSGLLNRRFETTAQKRDGTLFPVEMTITPVRVGESFVFSAFLHDITSRREDEDALRQSDARFRRLVESNIVGVTIDHFNGSILESNDAFLRMTGYSREELKSGALNWEEMTPEEFKGSTREAIETLRSTGFCTVREKEFFHKDGSRVPVLVGVTMLEESGDKCICITVDITERKRALSALQAAKEQADAANEAKSRFLANMSHEIRTPMNAIIGLTDLVLETQLEDLQRDYLRMVQTSAEALLAIINDILDFSKIEAGRLEIVRGEFRLRDLVGDVLKSLAVRAHENGLELAYDVNADVPEFVVGDAGRLRQILNNLIGNAIKFTEEGEVIVRVKAEPKKDTNLVLLRFEVRDTGIGIPTEKLDSIFDVFEQVDTSSTRRFAGTGLGLAITQRLVDLLGGEIWAESEVGQGTCLHFSCQVELAQSAASLPIQQQPAVLQGLHVLVVDDNETNGRILQGQLDNWGLRATRVESAKDAITALRQASSAGSPFDLAMVDGNMPEIDGFQLTELIRNDELTAETLIILLTSGGRPGDLARCEQLDISRYLTKPVKQSELLDAITAVLVSGDSGILTEIALEDGNPAAGEAARAFSDNARTGQLQILLAEDSLVNQRLAVGLLEKKGYQVDVVNDGQAALEAIRERDFDLILMDVQMPRMDGLEATGHIRKQEQETGEHIPIVAMTAHAMPEDRQRCLDAGMDEYVAKPIRSEALYSAIEQLTGVKTTSVAKPIANDWMKPTEHLDWQTAWDTVGGDLDLLQELISAFLEELPGMEQGLASAVEKENAVEVRQMSHKIKGSLRYFGAKPAYDLAYKLESCAEHGTMADAAGMVDALRKELAAIGPLLRKFLQAPADARGFDAEGFDVSGN